MNPIEWIFSIKEDTDEQKWLRLLKVGTVVGFGYLVWKRTFPQRTTEARRATPEQELKEIEDKIRLARRAENWEVDIEKARISQIKKEIELRQDEIDAELEDEEHR